MTLLGCSQIPSCGLVLIRSTATALAIQDSKIVEGRNGTALGSRNEASCGLDRVLTQTKPECMAYAEVIQFSRSREVCTAASAIWFRPVHCPREGLEGNVRGGNAVQGTVRRPVNFQEIRRHCLFEDSVEALVLRAGPRLFPICHRRRSVDSTIVHRGRDVLQSCADASCFVVRRNMPSRELTREDVDASRPRLRSPTLDGPNAVARGRLSRSTRPGERSQAASQPCAYLGRCATIREVAASCGRWSSDPAVASSAAGSPRPVLMRFHEGREPRHRFPDGWPSGQRQQTVNLSGYALRRFESFPVHHPLAG